jgi:hypothetical protein
MEKGIDFIGVAARWKRYAEEYTKESRDHYLEFTKALLNVSTFLIGFNIIWLEIKHTQLNPLDKIVFIVSFVSLIGSVFLAVASVLESNVFMKRAGIHFDKKSEMLIDYVKKSGITAAKDFPEEIKKEKIEEPVVPETFNWQIITFCTGVVGSALLALLFILF